jgi:DNA repair and recombination RAD54-like protein
MLYALLVQAMGGYSHSLKPKVLIMSYTTFRMHKAEVYKLGIDVVVCDEAHFLKNGEAQITQAVSQIPAKRRLLVSGVFC